MAVEAALVAPVVLLLIVGIIEMSLLMRDVVSVNNAVRSAARVASAAPGAGPGVCPTGPGAPPCTPASSPAFAQAAADAVQRAGSAMPQDSITSLIVYDANLEGFPLPEGNRTLTCSVSCVSFRWNAASNRFVYAGGAWASSSVNACVNSPLQDSVGVALSARHAWVTGLFGDGMTVSERTVMRFEPLTADQCLAGAHL